MRALALGVVAAVALSAGACASNGIDSSAKADLDARLAQLKTSDETYPPTEAFSPPELKLGQWTRHKAVDEKGEPSLLTYKVVGVESGGYWIEIVNESYRGRVVTKLFVTLSAGRDPAGMDIRTARVKKGDAPPVDLDAAASEAMSKELYASLDLLGVAIDPTEKDDAKVPAGHFVGCYTTQTPGPWGPWHSPSIVCAHSAVPLSGIVRARPVSGPGSLELVDFGTTSAGEL